MKLSGHVRLHRKVRENPVWTQLSPAVYKFMSYCIMEANWKPETWYTGDDEIVLPVGCFTCSLRRAATECNLTFRQVRDAIAHLEHLNIITTAHNTARGRAHGATMVTLLNYERYQIVGEEDGTEEGTQPGTQRAHKGHTPTPKNGVNPHNPLKTQQGSLLDGTPLKEEDLNTSIQKKTAEDALLENVAQRIHDRHPKDRRCSVSVVKAKLRTIRKSEPAATRAGILDRIDTSHAACCESQKWKDGYANGLEKWLAPTMRRWEELPPVAAPEAPRVPMVRL